MTANGTGTSSYDDAFGVCPICHKIDGFANAGRTHRATADSRPA
jgi:hypothetical protein